MLTLIEAVKLKIDENPQVDEEGLSFSIFFRGYEFLVKVNTYRQVKTYLFKDTILFEMTLNINEAFLQEWAFE